jgi:hypothetical protein
VIVDPPSLLGVLHDTVACRLPAVAVPMVGAVGTVAGVTSFDWADSVLVPATFTAATVNVYGVPFVSPVTVSVVAVELNGTGVCATPLMYGVTTYDVTADPPFDVGAVHVTVACMLPRVAVPMVGGSGVVAGVTTFEKSERGPNPMALMAATVNEYAVPLVSPVIVCDVAVSLNTIDVCATVPMYGVTS